MWLAPSAGKTATVSEWQARCQRRPRSPQPAGDPQPCASGAGQVDTLTGLAGPDVFLVGDSRRLFYDDKVKNSLGRGDYTLIKEFASGLDKFQLRAATTDIYATSTPGFSLHWDRNKDARITSSRKCQDELIAVLQGMTALSGKDLISV